MCRDYSQLPTHAGAGCLHGGPWSKYHSVFLISPGLKRWNYCGLRRNGGRNKQDDCNPSLIKMTARRTFEKCNGIYAALPESVSSSPLFTPLGTKATLQSATCASGTHVPAAPAHPHFPEIEFLGVEEAAGGSAAPAHPMCCLSLWTCTLWPNSSSGGVEMYLF